MELQKKSGVIRIVSALLFLATLAGPGAAFAKDKSLYDRLGGKKAITAVVDEFVSRVAAERLASFKGKLVDQICQATGGPCQYTGKDMKTAHAGMGISDADFNALVEDLSGALDKFNVGVKEKNELLGALGSMKSDIVGH